MRQSTAIAVIAVLAFATALITVALVHRSRQPAVVDWHQPHESVTPTVTPAPASPQPALTNRTARAT